MTKASALVIIVNELGVHARPAGAFSEMASRFASEITVTRVDTAEAGNGKSVMGLLKLALSHGSEIRIQAVGSDAQQAVDELVKLVETGFRAEYERDAGPS